MVGQLVTSPHILLCEREREREKSIIVLEVLSELKKRNLFYFILLLCTSTTDVHVLPLDNTEKFDMKGQCSFRHQRLHLAPEWGGRHSSKPVALRRMVASPDLCLLPLSGTATGPQVAVKTPRITSAMGPQVRLSKGVKGMAGCLGSSRGVAYQKDWGVWEFGHGGTKRVDPLWWDRRRMRAEPSWGIRSAVAV